MGQCKSCNGQSQPQEQTDIQTPLNPGKENIIKEFQNHLDGKFTQYQLVKTTKYSFSYSSVLRKSITSSSKVLNTLGTISPINIHNLRELNEFLKIAKERESGKIQIDKNMTFKCGLSLGDIIPEFNLIYLFTQAPKFSFQPNKYTLVRSWGQGEQMVNFEHAIDLVQQLGINLVGLVRGQEDQQQVFEENVKSNNWDQYNHVFIDQEDKQNEGHLFDIFYNEDIKDVEQGYLMSAMLFYGNKLIWKRYIYEFEISSDSDEFIDEVTQIVKNKVTNPKISKQNEQVQQITQQEYRGLKRIIQIDHRARQFNRNILISIEKKTIIYPDKKQIIYFQPELKFASSSRLLSTDELISDIKLSNAVSKKCVGQISSQRKGQLNCQKIFSNNKCLFRKVYQNTNQLGGMYNYGIKLGGRLNWFLDIEIAMVKQWITTRDEVLPDVEKQIQLSTNPVEKKINELVYNFFKTIPTVDKVLNQEYGKIPYAEKRKPPYEDLSVSKSLGTEEIGRKPDMVLFILLIDYENDDTVALLQEVVKLRLQEPKLNNLQIAVLGHIRAESWTRLFQAFMEKIKLAEHALNGHIETWFPVEDKIGSISFSAVLGRMYGMALERRDVMIIDKNNMVRVIDSSRKVIKDLTKIVDQLSQQPAIPPSSLDYSRPWQMFKKCFRANPNIQDICQQIQKECTDDNYLVLLEQKQHIIWEFEQGKISSKKRHFQPIRQIRGKMNLNELSQIIQKYIDDRDLEIIK
ncbi:hypothetical protein pb186bvf_015686 [Paramecium bursaria]